MVGTKKTLGKESDHINRDITEYCFFLLEEKNKEPISEHKLDRIWI